MLNDLDRLLDNLPEQFNLDDYQIIVVPENLASENNPSKWYQSPDALLFQKALFAQDILCAGPKETSWDPVYLDRRSSDIWLGAYWLLNTVVIPFFISILAAKFLSSRHAQFEELTEERKVIHTTIYFRRKDVSKIEFQGDPKTLIKILTAIGGIDGEA